MRQYEDIISHRVMLEDMVRTTAFERAIGRLVRPGMRVVDFGCGTGILSFFAARAGAKEVVGVDRAAILQVARLVGAANDLGNVRFIHGDESSVTLPEPADLLVSECLGYFGITEGMVGAFLRARDRWLVPGGTVCPREIRFQAHLVCEPRWYADLGFFGASPHGVDFSPIRDWPYHKSYVKFFEPCDVLPWAVDLGTVDLRRATHPPTRFEGSATPPGSAEVYGLAASFAAVLADDVVLDTSPISPRTHWGQVFFPFRRPFLLREGSSIRVEMVANQSRDGEIAWRWSMADDSTRIEMDNFVFQLWLHAEGRADRT